MNVTIQDMMRHLHADITEKSEVQNNLDRAKSVAKLVINRPLSDLDDNEKDVLNQIVQQLATSFYLNRDGSAKNVSKSFSSLNSLINLIRKPPLGG